MLLIGGDTSAVRAGTHGWAVPVGRCFGRLSTPLVLLAAAALAMTALDPLALYDAGFQLSVLATLGLILLAPACKPAIPVSVAATCPPVGPRPRPA